VGMGCGDEKGGHRGLTKYFTRTNRKVPGTGPTKPKTQRTGGQKRGEKKKQGTISLGGKKTRRKRDPIFEMHNGIGRERKGLGGPEGKEGAELEKRVFK